MRRSGSSAVRPIEWIRGLDGVQDLASKIEEGEQLSEDTGVKEKDGENGGMDEQIEIRSDEGEFGIRKARQLQDPKLPSEQDVKEHYANGHLPYRSWCHHCVRGRGRERDHRRRQEAEVQGLPEYHLDYCFPGDEGEHRLTVLVAVEKYTKMKKVVVVPSKGSTGKYASGVIVGFVEELGDKDRDIIVKTDQEPSIKFLVDDICQARTGAKTIKECAPKFSKGSNGIVERVVQSVEQCIRTLKSSFDERMKVKVDIQHPVITWLCDYAAYIMNRLEVGADGKTAYERTKGKQADVAGLEFGELVLWKHPPATRMQKLNARWSHGLFLGVRTRSGEIMVVDGESRELKYVRTVRRIPEQERWEPANLEWVTMVPWNRGKNDGEADGDLPQFDVKSGPGRKMTEQELVDIKTSDKPQIVHRAHLRRGDFDKHGYTDRCRGCSAILRGLHVQPHSEECRRRMEGLLEQDIRVKNAKVRLQERASKVKDNVDEGRHDDKRRRLQEIEDEAMREEDPGKLNELFEKYRIEYMKDRGDDDEGGKRQKVQKLPVLQERASSSGQAAEYEGMEVGAIDIQESYVMEVEMVSDDGGECLETLRAMIDPEMKLKSGDQDEHGEALKCHFGEEFAWDDVNNIPLPLNDVKTARKEEMDHMKHKIFKVVKKEEAWRVTGRAPISTKWVDTDKRHGTCSTPMVRSRWVARDFKDPADKDREDLFSATPPIEMMRLVISRQATRRKDGRERKTMYLDVKKAHLYPKCDQDVYVELPEEAEVAEDECGKLEHWLYGCRPAAQAWEEHYSEVLKNHGFVRLRCVPVVFVHPERDMTAAVHGDDFVFEGLDEDLDYILKVLEANYELKNRGRLGSGAKDLKQIDLLGRIIKLEEDGITWQGDPRHQRLLEDYFGMDSTTKTLSKNGYDDGDTNDEEGLTEAEFRSYRMLAARLNYLAQDNPMVQYTAKEVCRAMSFPNVKDFVRIKKVVRFLKGLGQVVWKYYWQGEEEAGNIKVYVDSDWAGCKETRRSTSGGVVKVGRHVLRTWSSTQPTIATSSGEAELIAMADGAARGLGLKTVLSEMGMKVRLNIVQVCTDSSVAKSFVSTRGLGKMRHLEVKILWLQECVRRGRLCVGKVSGSTNIADALTKYQSAERLAMLCSPHGILTTRAGGPAGRGRRTEGGCEECVHVGHCEQCVPHVYRACMGANLGVCLHA